MAKGEISWLGNVERYGELDLLIDEIFLIKQETTPTKTQFDDDAMAEFLTKYHLAGKDIGKLKLWLHTHNNFAVSWSGRDEDTIANYSRSEFLISVVTNKFGDLLARIDIFQPLRLTVEGIQVAVLPNFSDEEIRMATLEIGQKVAYIEPPKTKYVSFMPEEES